ncbi:hypothetical protein BH11BAC1_BH11BAC1_23110 [soil metagenome]
MERFFKSDSFKFWLFALVIFLSRIPFLSQGYGLDGDSWSVAITARDISQTGSYAVSRFPGYPVQELICSLFYNGYAWRLNLLTAIISTIGILFFALTLKTWKFKYVFLASAALAFVPIIYINSTTTIDYVWALSFLLISLYSVSRYNAIMAGIFLGLAIGCRITSGAMLIPYAVMILQTGERKENILRLLKLSLTTIITAALLFYPVYSKYGGQFFMYYDLPYPSISKVLYKFFIETWGLVGLLALFISVAVFFLPNTVQARRYLFPRSINEKYVVAWLIAIDLYIIAFLKLPMESGYLIPIIPFVILIFGKYLYSKAFAFLAVMLILSSFFFNMSPVEREDAASASSLSFIFNQGEEKLSVDVLDGPIRSYESRRENGMKYTSELLQSFDTLRRKSVLVCGRWYYQLYLQRKSFSELDIQICDYIKQDSLLYFIGKGYDIYYLPKQDYYNRLMRNVDMNLFGAKCYIREKNSPL